MITLETFRLGIAPVVTQREHTIVCIEPQIPIIILSAILKPVACKLQ